MKIMTHSILSVILGFLGGIAATKFELRLPSRHASALVRAGTVRANRFELVGPSDNLLAYWTQDWQKQKILIAFVDDKGRSRAEFGTEARLVDAGRQVVESPFTALIGSDGGIRIREGLDPSQNPVLAMGDSAGENRCYSGIGYAEMLPETIKIPGINGPSYLETLLGSILTSARRPLWTRSVALDTSSSGTA